MAKFHGFVGYVHTEETAPSKFEEIVTERPVSGEILRNSQRWQETGKVNDNPVISNEFRIIGDAFAYQHLQGLRYLKWQGIKWKVTSIDVSRPPAIYINVGDVYNG